MKTWSSKTNVRTSAPYKQAEELGYHASEELFRQSRGIVPQECIEPVQVNGHELLQGRLDKNLLFVLISESREVVLEREV